MHGAKRAEATYCWISDKALCIYRSRSGLAKHSVRVQRAMLVSENLLENLLAGRFQVLGTTVQREAPRTGKIFKGLGATL